jgi:hypothetical protein
MRNSLQQDSISWTPPWPLWRDSATAAMQEPAILRFATDDFMEELQRLLAADPTKLRGFLAVPETWRGIQTSDRTLSPAAGRIQLLERLGVTARRGTAATTARSQPHSSVAGRTLKLYQPAHQRFYLVGASLICQRPGMPDRRIEKGNEERGSFVIRRFFPPTPAASDDNLPGFNQATWTECAFVAQTEGGFAWQEVAAAGSADEARRVVLSEEERLPLFPMNFTEDNQRTRRMLAGLIPVGRREAYQAAARKTSSDAPAGGGSTELTARLVLFRKLVSEPWKALVDRAVFFKRAGTESVNGNTSPPTVDELRRFRSDVETSSWLLLADLREFLATYVPTVWAQIQATTTSPAITPSPGSLLGDSLALYTSLLNTRFGRFLSTNPLPTTITNGVEASRTTVATCVADALKRLTQPVIDAMENVETSFQWTLASAGWPTFLFPLVETDDPLISDAVNPFGNSPVPVVSLAPPLTETEEELMDSFSAADADALDTAADKFKEAIDAFATLVVRAIEDVPGAPQPAVPTAAQRPADLRPALYVIRCVYERPACGDLHDDVVSGPSERFQLAGFFDPDAPARPIRIGLPVDTTPAGLRKFDKNTAFVMSDVLCGQIARMRGLTLGDLVRSVLPWPLHKDLSVPEGGPCKQGAAPGVNIGLICSLSIPIITICALILLMIMVSLLDYIFRWIPYFIVCFPLPGLRAKPK